MCPSYIEVTGGLEVATDPLDLHERNAKASTE
jgi:hypothetical protein